MIGYASMASPIADGIVSNNASRIARASVARNSAMFPSAALRETSGSVTVPMATPKIPSGNCIRRNAMLSQLTGPSPRLRRKSAVDQHVHLHRAGRDDRRSH